MWDDFFENGEKEIRDSLKKVGWTFTKLFIAIWIIVVLLTAAYWWGSFAIGAVEEITHDEPRVQQYDDLKENLWAACLNVSENRGNPTVVYIGYTIAEEDAIKTAKYEVKRYNDEVDCNYANYKSKLNTSLNPYYLYKIDCYFDPETRGILFLKEGVNLVDPKYKKIN